MAPSAKEWRGNYSTCKTEDDDLTVVDMTLLLVIRSIFFLFPPPGSSCSKKKDGDIHEVQVSIAMGGELLWFM